LHEFGHLAILSFKIAEKDINPICCMSIEKKHNIQYFSQNMSTVLSGLNEFDFYLEELL
jgi:hypothetical protein